MLQEMEKDNALEMMEDFEMNDEELEKELDRLYEMFKQLEVEQEMEQMIEKLEELGAEVVYHDPHVPVIPVTREHAEYAGRKSEETVSDNHDLVLLSTGHDEYKAFDFSGFTTPLVDTRNAVDPDKRPEKYYQA